MDGRIDRLNGFCGCFGEKIMSVYAGIETKIALTNEADDSLELP